MLFALCLLLHLSVFLLYTRPLSGKVKIFPLTQATSYLSSDSVPGAAGSLELLVQIDRVPGRVKTL